MWTAPYELLAELSNANCGSTYNTIICESVFLLALVGCLKQLICAQDGEAASQIGQLCIFYGCCCWLKIPKNWAVGPTWWLIIATITQNMSGSENSLRSPNSDLNSWFCWILSSVIIMVQKINMGRAGFVLHTVDSMLSQSACTVSRVGF